MFSDDQRHSIRDRAAGKITTEALLAELRVEPAGIPDFLSRQLRDAQTTHSEEQLGDVLYLVRLLGADANISSELSVVLLEDWHHKHEDIVFELGKIAEPGATEALSQVAERVYPYLAWDDNFAFNRKCAWALFNIGTEEAFKQLERLADSKNPQIREFAIERLIDAGRPGALMGEQFNAAMAELSSISFVERVRKAFADIAARRGLKELPPSGNPDRNLVFGDDQRKFSFVIEYATGYANCLITPAAGEASRSDTVFVSSLLKRDGVSVPQGPDELFVPGQVQAVISRLVEAIRNREEVLFSTDWRSLVERPPERRSGT